MTNPALMPLIFTKNQTLKTFRHTLNMRFQHEWNACKTACIHQLKLLLAATTLLSDNHNDIARWSSFRFPFSHHPSLVNQENRSRNPRTQVTKVLSRDIEYMAIVERLCCISMAVRVSCWGLLKTFYSVQKLISKLQLSERTCQERTPLLIIVENPPVMRWIQCKSPGNDGSSKFISYSDVSPAGQGQNYATA